MMISLKKKGNEKERDDSIHLPYDKRSADSIEFHLVRSKERRSKLFEFYNKDIE